jgi:hypothetical protein
MACVHAEKTASLYRAGSAVRSDARHSEGTVGAA